MKSIQLDTQKRKFNKLEDELILKMHGMYGKKCWKEVGRMLGRNPRTCRERYRNYLSQTIETKPWSHEEDDILRAKYEEIGPRWMELTRYLPGRTDINIKNRWALLLRHKEKNRLKAEANNKLLQSVYSDSAQQQMTVEQEQVSNTYEQENDPFDFIDDNFDEGFLFDYYN